MQHHHQTVFGFHFVQASNVDDVLAYHTDFLNNCLKDCMLTNPDLLKIVHKLMMVCVTYSNFIMVSLSSLFIYISMLTAS